MLEVHRCFPGSTSAAELGLAWVVLAAEKCKGVAASGFGCGLGFGPAGKSLPSSVLPAYDPSPCSKKGLGLRVRLGFDVGCTS